MLVNIEFLDGNKVKLTVSNDQFQCHRIIRYWSAWLLKARLRRVVRVLKRAIAATEAVEAESNA